jgi:tetratricopeptide (TPR) repeat protein
MKDNHTETMLALLKQACLPENLLDENGELIPGKVVRHFRERMVYSNQDGKVKHWTQADLATKLDVSEVWVTLMETQNKGLDSIERRRTIATLLKIPPGLLGLASFDLMETLKQLSQTSGIAVSKHQGISDENIHLYQNALSVYTGLYSDRTIQASVPGIEHLISQISVDVQNLNSKQKHTVLDILWNFHLLAAKVYGYDICNWKEAFSHLNKALEVALTLNYPDLIAATYYRIGDFHLLQGNVQVAKEHFNRALPVSKSASLNTKCGVYALASLSYARSATDTSGAIEAQNLLDKAYNYIGIVEGNSAIKFSESWYLDYRAETLIALKRYGKALESIEEAEYIATDKRNLEFTNILKAECYISRKKPEFEEAVTILSSVLQQNRTVREQVHIHHIQRLFNLLLDSSYGNSLEVADLGMLLRELQLKK